MSEAAARIKSAGDQLGAAMADAVKLAFRRAVATQLTDDLGSGPWLLFPDGRVHRFPEDAPEDAPKPTEEPYPPDPPDVPDS